MKRFIGWVTRLFFRNNTGNEWRIDACRGALAGARRNQSRTGFEQPDIILCADAPIGRQFIVGAGLPSEGPTSRQAISLEISSLFRRIHYRRGKAFNGLQGAAHPDAMSNVDAGGKFPTRQCYGQGESKCDVGVTAHAKGVVPAGHLLQARVAGSNW